MPSPSWSVIVPVKRPDVGKSRLAAAVGERRPVLARAFAADTVAAVRASPLVERVVVVTDDTDVAADARALGAVVVSDGPTPGLNAALLHGLDAIGADVDAVAALTGDLPALRTAELDRVLADAATHRTAVLSDAAGIGTTIYTALSAAEFAPHFGGRSRAAHRLGGAAELDRTDVPSARRDVDTEVDLWDAQRLGVGPRTAAVLSA